MLSAARFRELSDEEAITKESVISEIVNTLKDKMASPAFESFIEHKLLTPEAKNKREISFTIEFVDYHHRGCPNTYFSVGCMKWTNGKNAYKSQTYKGYRLRSLRNEVCIRLSDIVTDYFQRAGFNVQILSTPVLYSPTRVLIKW